MTTSHPNYDFDRLAASLFDIASAIEAQEQRIKRCLLRAAKQGEIGLVQELMELWLGIAAEHQLPLRGGLTFEGVERGDDGLYVVYAGGRTFKARHVCLAIGRRGTPRKLDVPGEHLSKVAYSLLEPEQFAYKHSLVVGGGVA